MAEGKWITELTPATPLPDAARRALSLRFQVVHHYLPLAIRESEKDLEYVHQLRVGTRRAGAALEIFALCLPAKEYRVARKHLRRIRRAAGAARDWDVFLSSLPALEKTTDRRWRTQDLLTGYGLSQRTSAQAQLELASPNYPFDFERFMAETVAAVHKPHTQPDMQVLRDLAQPLLAQLLRELHRAATENLNDYDHLHQVRILGKRLRYAMEIVADCFAPAFRSELYPMVEEMQEILGAANDSHVATQRLELLRASCGPFGRPTGAAIVRASRHCCAITASACRRNGSCSSSGGAVGNTPAAKKRFARCSRQRRRRARRSRPHSHRTEAGLFERLSSRPYAAFLIPIPTYGAFVSTGRSTVTAVRAALTIGSGHTPSPSVTAAQSHSAASPGHERGRSSAFNGERRYIAATMRR